MEHVVLVVDDEPLVYNALRRTLHREDYKTLYAGSPEEAERILDGSPVDVAIVDMHMPGANGAQLLMRMKQKWPSVVRIMLTGDRSLDVVMKAVNTGEVFRFFVKPANEAELIVAIRDAIQTKAARPEDRRAPASNGQAGDSCGEETGEVIRLDGSGEAGDMESLLKQMRSELDQFKA